MPNPYDKGVGSAWGDGGLLPSTLYGASAISFLQGFSSNWVESSVQNFIPSSSDPEGFQAAGRLMAVPGRWEKVSNRGLSITGAQTLGAGLATESLLVAASYGALQFIGADLLIPEPTDFFVPKYVAYAVVAIVATAVIYTVTDYFARDAGPNDKHGDGGRTIAKSERQIADLNAQLATATGKTAQQIKQKIQNIRRNGEKARKGTEDSNGNKR